MVFDPGDTTCPVWRLGYSTGQMTWVLRQINDQEKKVEGCFQMKRVTAAKCHVWTWFVSKHL